VRGQKGKKWLGIEPAILDLGSPSGAYDLSASATPYVLLFSTLLTAFGKELIILKPNDGNFKTVTIIKSCGFFLQ